MKKKKKISLRMIIFGLVGTLLLMAVGEVGWIFAFRSQFFAETESEEEEELVVAPFFVHMDSLVVPVIRNNQVERHVMLTLALEVGDNHSRSRVQKAKNQIRDAFVRDLHGYMRVMLIRSHDDFLRLLKVRLLRVVAGVMGPGVVREVLIQQAAERDVL